MNPADALVDENLRLGELLATADPEVSVPTCPGWTLRQLLTHVGRGDRWAAMIVRDRAQERVDIRAVPEGKPSADDPVGWLAGSARLLVDAVAATGPDVPVWTFTGPKPAVWWIRRRLHEATVHRADASIALGVPFAIEPALAADAVSEWLDVLAARPAPEAGPALADGATLHLHATDDGLGTDGEWLVRSADGRLAWEHGHGKGAVAVRGRAADILQAVTRRIPADDPRLQVLGDETVWRTWLERTPF
ncbi:maleylpyruvate isomerase family mycothiol-dependent enzyme [Pseudonocardia cypriaca]|uniref:Uncharacterized protein (TIGR03083 family) n=1 Tax=Pseudonocardia cypriaca TaxID=882449 RepID=A0A543GDE7_9PSEU|nr:maleylpyruvate isomerase family mycothiol-dependent enzyme [Pseudonocardia cypriaca]TQM44094.1 uncharacterized protein (TIGR03083 family) [Pseudonocardia cypriaca]